MNTAPNDGATISTVHLEIDPSDSTKRDRRRRLATTLALAALTVAAVAPGVAAVALAQGDGHGADSSSARTEPTDRSTSWQAVNDSCMRTAAGSPDAVLRHAEACAERATAFFTSDAYVACLGGMSPDAALRWSSTCVGRIIVSDR